MRVFWITVLLVKCLLVLSAADSFADTFKITIVINAVDSREGSSKEANVHIKNQAESYLKRELRELDDVVIVSSIEEANYSIDLMVFRIPSGYCISSTYYAVTHTTKNNSWWDDGQIPKSCEPFIENILSFFDGVLTIQGGLSATQSADGLKNTCNAIVADFDVNVLEPRRMRER